MFSVFDSKPGLKVGLSSVRRNMRFCVRHVTRIPFLCHLPAHFRCFSQKSRKDVLPKTPNVTSRIIETNFG